MEAPRDARPDLLAFVHLLRAAGLTVPVGQVVAFTRAAAELAPVDAIDVYWAGRTTLVSHPGDRPTYDRVFRAFFLDEHHGRSEADETTVTVEAETTTTTHPAVPEPPGERDETEAETIGAVASGLELLRHRRFDQATDAELRAMRRLMSRIELTVPHRVTRRTEPVRRGRVPDLRRSMRRALQTDGELVRRAWRQRRSKPRSLVLILDVSGSMAGYSRALLQFAYTAAASVGRVEVFCFGTRLTRITEDLAGRDVDAALAGAARKVVDWDGGTMIGASLAALNRSYARRGLLRGAVVLICSDGLERGDPDQLATEMARVARYAHRVVWVNPLRGDAAYRPVQRGMRAALPYIDRLVAGHDLASLDELATVMKEL